jgi:hypothetical protein
MEKLCLHLPLMNVEGRIHLFTIGQLAIAILMSADVFWKTQHLKYILGGIFCCPAL